MVNGTLRNVIRNRDENAITYPTHEDDTVKYMSVVYSMPEPLTRAIVADYGAETAEKIISYRPAARYEPVRPNYLRMNDIQFQEYAQRKTGSLRRASCPARCGSPIPATWEGDRIKGWLFSMQGEAAMLAAMGWSPRPRGPYWTRAPRRRKNRLYRR
jgi:16S rRNA C967 or C1407 C5-methylase (RsmB/RsmF family)